MEKIHYYAVRREFENQDVEALLDGKAKATRWLRGETEDEYETRLQKESVPAGPARLYMEKYAVRRETIDILDAHRKIAMKQLYHSQSPRIHRFLREGTHVKTLENMPHLGYFEIASMVIHYPDKSRSLIRIVGSNFEACVVPVVDGLQFKSIPPQVDGVQNQRSFFAYGRKFKEDGTIGEIDPVFSRDGVAFQPKGFIGIAEAVRRAGEMSIQCMRRR